VREGLGRMVLQVLRTATIEARKKRRGALSTDCAEEDERRGHRL